jgi:peptide/nickel transport system substrate-binding protein
MISGTLIISVLLGVFVFGTSVEAQPKPAEKPKYGGRLIFGSLKDISTTNPFMDTVSVDYNIRSLMLEGLTGTDIRGNIVPSLAKSWEVSKDGLTYTFALRPNVKFHNGKTLTSEDVKWSLDYLRDPKNKAYYLDQFTEVKSIETPDSQTVVILLKRPFAPFATMVATARAPILPAGSQLSANAFPPGTGPFRFVEWQSGRNLSYKAFKEYWIRGVPYLDEIVFKPIVEDNVRFTAFRAKEIDIADELHYSVVAEAKKGKADFIIEPHEAGVRRRIVFNTRMPPFNDVKIRQAIAYAIDKKELAAAQTWGFAQPTNQRYPKNSIWHIDLPDREQDPQKARALLAEAGHKDGLKVKVPVYPGPDMELTVVLKDQLKKIGIELELDVMDWAAHTKLRRNLQYTLYSAGMGARTDPNQIYYADMYSKSRQNGSGYSNPEVDQLLDKANVVHDVKERKRLYTEVLKHIQRDVPEIYLYLGDKFLGVQPYVKNFSTGFLEDRIHFTGGGLAYTWLEK